MFIIVFLFVAFVQLPEEVVELFEGDYGTSEEEVLEVFGKYEEAFSWWKILSPFGRVAQFLILLGMAALNVTFVTSNFLSLPKRDPAETANMSKYFVAWLESPMVICFGCLTMALFMHAACSGADVAGMVKCLRFTGSFSALRTLQMASPFNAMNEILETYRNKGLAMAAVSFLHLSFFAPVAVMAVLVKLSQVDFATETIVDHWSPFQFLAFAAFINNLAGLRGDISKERKLAIFKSQDSRDPEAVLDVWEKQLGTTLQKLYGFLPALVLIGTLSVDDVCHLLNPTIRYHRYHLVSEWFRWWAEALRAKLWPNGHMSLFHSRMGFQMEISKWTKPMHPSSITFWSNIFFLCQFEELTTWAKLFLVKLGWSWACIGCGGRQNAKLVNVSSSVSSGPIHAQRGKCQKANDGGGRRSSEKWNAWNVQNASKCQRLGVAALDS